MQEREKAITGFTARQMRQDLGLSQEAFWGAIGVRRETGNNYERHGRLTEPVRRLLFLHYTAGIPVNGSPDALVRIGRLARADESATETLLKAAAQMGIAATHIKAAVEAMLTKESHHG